MSEPLRVCIVGAGKAGTNLAMALAECPDMAEAISSRATEFYKARSLRALEEGKGKIDLVYSGGDVVWTPFLVAKDAEEMSEGDTSSGRASSDMGPTVLLDLFTQ